MVEIEEGRVFVPGDEIASDISGYEIGEGCYSMNGKIISSIVGRVKIDVSEDAYGQPHKRIFVERTQKERKTDIVPNVKDIVTCRVIRINERLAQVNILCVGELPVKVKGFKGFIRKENVRSSEVDKVKIQECFRPGDLVRAKVAALGYSESFELSTAADDLGVVRTTT